jgi:signal transduction histidine kinase
MEAMLFEQKVLSEAAVLTAEEKERKRIAADLHDNLGAYAAAISSSIKYLKDGVNNRQEVIAQLDENAGGIVSHLNDTIWVLKNEKLHFTNLADRFKLWLQRLLINYPQIKYHFTEEITNDIEFTPNRILHLFSMLKESVNNAIKHSNCSDLWIHFYCGEQWRIETEDNGTGFTLDQTIPGNGIENMKQRATECGWNIAWKQNDPQGTRLIISDTTIN